MYFDSVNVSNYCLNLTPYAGSWAQSGGAFTTAGGSYVYVAYDGTTYSHTNNWGGQITSDSYGNVYGVFKVPANIFKSGQLEFKLTDISNLALGDSAVTTQATYSMFCSALSVQKQKSLLTIRSAQVVVQEVADTQTIYQNSTNTNEWTVPIAASPVQQDPPQSPVTPVTTTSTQPADPIKPAVVEVTPTPSGYWSSHETGDGTTWPEWIDTTPLHV